MHAVHGGACAVRARGAAPCRRRPALGGASSAPGGALSAGRAPGAGTRAWRRRRAWSSSPTTAGSSAGSPGSRSSPGPTWAASPPTSARRARAAPHARPAGRPGTAVDSHSEEHRSVGRCLAVRRGKWSIVHTVSVWQCGAASGASCSRSLSGSAARQVEHRAHKRHVLLPRQLTWRAGACEESMAWARQGLLSRQGAGQHAAWRRQLTRPRRPPRAGRRDRAVGAGRLLRAVR